MSKGWILFFTLVSVTLFAAAIANALVGNYPAAIFLAIIWHGLANNSGWVLNRRR